MTCIVAAPTDQGVILAADAQTVTSYRKMVKDGPKLWTAAPYALGTAGCLRTAQVIRHHTTWPTWRAGEDAGDDFEHFAVTALVPAIRDAARDRGVTHNGNGIEALEADLLLAVGDEIAIITGNGAVLRDARKRNAIGSGAEHAIGHLGDHGPWTEDDVVEAVRRAATNSRGCGGPVSVLRVRDMTIRTLD